MRAAMRALFIFAHQDDEMAAAARIASLVRDGATVSFVFLTDGEGGSATSHVRDEESRRVLVRLGVDLANVHFLGSEQRIPDGSLYQHLDRALALVEERVTGDVDDVWTLSWEGGHQDHDAAHLVALAFAKRRGVSERVYEVPLYHGHGTRGPFFRALNPLQVGNAWNEQKVSFREGLRIASLCRLYASQRRTWLAILPAAIARLLLDRRAWWRRADATRLMTKPHQGALFYERRFGVSWDEFQRSARPFIESHELCL